MKVAVRNLYTDQEKTFEGDEQSLCQQLIQTYDWLWTGTPRDNDLQFLVGRLDGTQALEAEIVPELGVDGEIQKSESETLLVPGDEQDLQNALAHLDQYRGFTPDFDPVFRAGQILGRNVQTTPQILRASLMRHPNKLTAVAQARGLATEDGLSAISAMASLIGDPKVTLGDKVDAETVEPVNPWAEDAANDLQRAFKTGMVRAVLLNGKYSLGSMVAWDPTTEHGYLLKSNKGQSPAAGVREQSASPARREVGFWLVARQWGLDDDVPRADLISVDGQDVAAIKMLFPEWDNLGRKLGLDSGAIQRLFQPYLDSGELHKWAVLDYVLGNPDRNEENIMINESDSTIQLIDHGSAFAGPDFDPGHDQNSFVPFYLRAWAPDDFGKLEPHLQLQQLPEPAPSLDRSLRDWIYSLDAALLESILERLGIDSEACLDRLARIKIGIQGRFPPTVINELWIRT